MGKYAHVTHIVLLTIAIVTYAPPMNAQPPMSALPDGYRGQPVAVRPGLAPGMKVTQVGKAPRTFEVVLTRGDEVASGMTEFAQKYHLKASQVTAVGAFSSATLGWGDPERKAMKLIPIDSEVEVVLNGNITLNDGKPVFHAHVICAFADGTTKGGHLLDARIGIVMQAFVTEADMGTVTSDRKQ